MRKLITLLLFPLLVSAQYNLFARQNFAYKVSNGTNTEIGGVAATISTPALLATKLGISVGAISNFTIVGSDIKCRITGSYVIPTNCWNGNTSITSYVDSDYLITSVLDGAFSNTNLSGRIDFRNATSIGTNAFRVSNVTEFLFYNATSVGDGCFYLTPLAKQIYIPKCTLLGTTSGDNAVFLGIDATAKIYANPSLATNNAGNPDGDLTYASGRGSIIRYVSNFTAPNPVTDLASGGTYNTAIKLNFTAPTGSTNAIDYYEVYKNGTIQTLQITTSGQYVTGLTSSTSYDFTLIAVDIFYNKSVISNTLSLFTTNRIAVDADAIAYISASSNSIYQDIIDDMFVSLKSNSLYSKIQSFYPNIGTASQQKYNGKNPLDTDAAFRLTYSGTATFSDLGYTPNGSNGYANSYFSPSVNQTLNSNGITIVSGTNSVPTSGDVYETGSQISSSQSSILSVKVSSGNLAAFRMQSSYVTASTGANARGIFTGTKQSSTVSKLFKNGSLIGTGTGGGTLPTINIFIGAINLGGTPYGYSNQRIQSVWFHEGLSDAETATFHAIIDTFESLIGRKTW